MGRSSNAVTELHKAHKEEREAGNMALIQCPECGQSVSDKTSKCPKCGYPIQEYLNKMVAEGNGDNQIIASEAFGGLGNVLQASEKKRNRKMIVMVVLAVCVVSLTVLGIILFFHILTKRLIVEDITISKWRLTDSSELVDYYEGTITSQQKRPFVAVIGRYGDAESVPQFVVVEDGVGVIETSEIGEEDPSIKYRPIGYTGGNVLKPSDIKVKYTDHDYIDLNYSESTNCNVLIDIVMEQQKTGIIVFDIINETNHETEKNMVAVVCKGKASYDYYAGLPYKSRGIDLSIVPKIFCESAAVGQEDYSIKKAYTAEKSESSYSNSYSGKEILDFSDYGDGFVLYTSELKEGGDKENRNVVEFRRAFLRKGECTLTTYDSVDEDETILWPKYEFHVVGYITWTPLEKETK